MLKASPFLSESVRGQPLTNLQHSLISVNNITFITLSLDFETKKH